MNRNTVIAVALLAVLCSRAWAVNKCTLADGKIVYQDAACGITTKTSVDVKTWTNDGYSGQRTKPADNVTPNLKLVGQPGSEALLELYRRWADAERLALSTGRIALAGPAANLQALQREVEALKVPECLAGAQKILATLITKSSEAILRFMGKDELTGMVYQIVDKRKLVPEFEAAVTSSSCQKKE